MWNPGEILDLIEWESCPSNGSRFDKADVEPWGVLVRFG